MHRAVEIANDTVGTCLRISRTTSRDGRRRARPLVARLLLLLTLALATGGLLLPESPAYAQGKKSGKKGKKSGKKKSKKGKKPGKKSGKKKPVQPAAFKPPAAAAKPAPAAPAARPDGNGGAAADGQAAAGSGDGAGDGSTPDAAQDNLDVDSLRQEYLSLRDELFRSRARAATVASAMYSTRLRIDLTFGSARFYTVTRAIVRLDGASVFDDASGAIANDPSPRFEGFVAPGRHLITVRIEATGKDDERFTTAVENTFAIQAPAGKDVTVTVKAKDDGDIAYAWQKKQRGSYQPSLSIVVKTSKRAAAKTDKTARRQAPAKPRTRTAEADNAR